jgi:hypothetical protein
MACDGAVCEICAHEDAAVGQLGARPSECLNVHAVSDNSDGAFGASKEELHKSLLAGVGSATGTIGPFSAKYHQSSISVLKSSDGNDFASTAG